MAKMDKDPQFVNKRIREIIKMVKDNVPQRENSAGCADFPNVHGSIKKFKESGVITVSKEQRHEPMEDACAL